MELLVGFSISTAAIRSVGNFFKQRFKAYKKTWSSPKRKMLRILKAWSDPPWKIV